MAVYLPLQVNAKLALGHLHSAISKPSRKLHTLTPNLGTPNFHQTLELENMKCPTRSKITLDNVYTNMANAYRAPPCPHLGHSDHFFISDPTLQTSHQ